MVVRLVDLLAVARDGQRRPVVGDLERPDRVGVGLPGVDGEVVVAVEPVPADEVVARTQPGEVRPRYGQRVGRDLADVWRERARAFAADFGV